MDIYRKVERVFSTRLGTRPGNPTYGTRLYLLRDKRADGEAGVYFAKYAHEDIVRSEPTIEVKEAKLISIEGDKVKGRIVFSDDSYQDVEVKL